VKQVAFFDNDEVMENKEDFQPVEGPCLVIFNDDRVAHGYVPQYDFRIPCVSHHICLLEPSPVTSKAKLVLHQWPHQNAHIFLGCNLLLRINLLALRGEPRKSRWHNCSTGASFRHQYMHAVLRIIDFCMIDLHC